MTKHIGIVAVSAEGAALWTPSTIWFLRCKRSLAFVPLLLVFWTGCKDSPRLVKEGPLFAAPEKAPPAKALIYIYWPPEEQGRRNRLWVIPCEGLSQEISPGGYTTFVVDPGPSCFQAEAQSELLQGRRSSVSVSQSLGSVELNAEPGRTFFIRLEQGRLPLIPRIVLRRVKSEVADPEIRRCHRLIPLTPDEMARQYLEEKAR
jgi:hypothetical protein